MTMQPSWGNRAVQMAEEGKSIETIAKELGVGYREVWQHVKEAGGVAGWRAAKWITTNRLNKMARSNDSVKREQLRKEAAECVEYLYSGGKTLRDKIDSARKSLSY